MRDKEGFTMSYIESVNMSHCLLLVAFSITAMVHCSAAKQAVQCGASTQPCRMLFLGCPPGETIEIQNAYHVQKQTRWNCHFSDATDYCDSTYLSRCCSNVTEHDSIVNFTSSEMASITLCDNIQNCSELILVNSINLQVVEYHCKRVTTDSNLSLSNFTATSSLITEDKPPTTLAPPSSKTVPISLSVGFFLLGGFVTFLYCMKRYKTRSHLNIKNRENDDIMEPPVLNTGEGHEYSEIPVDHSVEEYSVYNHLNEPGPRVDGDYDTAASTLAFLQRSRTKDTCRDVLSDEEETYNHVGDAQERVEVVDNIYCVVQSPMVEGQC